MFRFIKNSKIQIIVVFMQTALVLMLHTFYMNSFVSLTKSSLKSSLSTSLKNNDSIKVISQLTNFKATYNNSCMSLFFKDQQVYGYNPSSCSNPLTYRSFSITDKNNSSLRLEVMLPAPAMLNYLTLFFLVLTIALVYIGFRNILREERKHTRELKIASEEKLALSYKVAHDIRSPLKILNQLINNESETNKEIIQLSLKKLNETAQGLLKSRKESLPNQEVCLNDVIKNVIKLKTIEHSDLKVTNTFDKKYFTLGSSIDLQSILSNLINNSYEAGARFIQFELTDNSKIISLNVKDNGEGIPDSILEQIGEGQLTSKEQGNGLGLYSAKKTLKEYSGDLKVISTSKNGTNIELNLNLSRAEELTDKREVLFLDDDKLNRLIWKNRAKQANVTLHDFSNSKEFFEKISSFSKSIEIYLDLELKEKINGLEVAQKLFDRGYKNLYLATAYDQDELYEIKNVPNIFKSIVSKTPSF